jgi:hypothetical protein
MPEAVGVPLMVRTLEAQAAETPAGSPLAPCTPAFAIPVAPVVVRVMLVKAELIQSVGVEDAVPGVFKALTVTASVLDELIPQGFCAVTLMLPF